MTTAKSTVDDIGARVAEVVRSLAARAALTRAQAYRLRLAADEIATNIVLHGYGGEGEVGLCGGVAEDHVWLRTEDSAPPFDPRDHDPSPVLTADPATRAPGGLGVHLALAAVDELRYEQVAGLNHTTLVVYRDA
ncbi:ATP-binding protein [Saccharothrix obliqua]|uniref:ATP-binding protein n=1 Tax=Saccharothrix obliqua TaxID=2861747 RepID=UPI001C5D1B1D|nr:ATP-binding protein [Saccharothrix obliqua]MBW4717745.1 ATP-binding protein [Saccharothrix obliqua]